MRIPAARPASGSGSARRSASPAASRRPCRLPPSAGARIRTLSARRLPEAPVRRRYSPYGSSSGGGRSWPSTSTTAPAATTGKAGRVAATTHLARRRLETQSRDLAAVPAPSSSTRRSPARDRRPPGASAGAAPPARRARGARAAWPRRLRPSPWPRADHGRVRRPIARSPHRPVQRSGAGSRGKPRATTAAPAATPTASHALRGTTARGALTGRRSRAPGSSPASPHRPPCATRSRPAP